MIEDDRSAEERKTHTVLITATDKFLSGWGCAKGGLSKCAWACKPEHEAKVLAWVKARSDMKYVNVSYGRWQPKNYRHCHIYTVNENHPSLQGRER